MFKEEAEGRMILAQLEKISKLSAALMDKISDSDDLEGWVQNKIDLAEDYIQTVYDYMTYNADSVSEGLEDPKDNPCWKGYKPVGTKVKNGKKVPNCVPEEKKMKTFKEFRESLNECGCDNVIAEKSPNDPEIEKWIKSNKVRFKKEYGEKKGTEVLYAKAWDMYNKKHKK